MRIVVRGDRRDFGLGSVSLVDLDEARAKADEIRKLARGGGDPKEQKEAAAKIYITFDELAEKTHQEWIVKEDSNGKHIDQWINTLRTYAYPVIGKKPVHLISRSDIFKVLNPIWKTKHETARRVRQRMSVVFDFALEAEIRTDGNPVADVLKNRNNDAPKVKHFKAVDWIEASAIYCDFRSREEIGALALCFTISTAVRSGAVRQARWHEIDECKLCWDIPEGHMKAREPFSVPLNAQARVILDKVEKYRIGSDSLIFPSPNGQDKMLSENTMRKLLQTRRPGLTVHGFRTSFRQFAEDETNFSREVKEYSLAHTVGSKTERAYNRGDYFDERIKLMDEWGLALAEGSVFPD
ncbi:integrase [Planktotalea lamellibrachiae]|nr:integrase [Aliiroseovarius lamellibrachiae]